MLYVDADALSKLAHWNILPMLPALTGYSWQDIATISSLKHRAGRSQESPDRKLFHTVEAAKLAFICISKMRPLTDPNTEIMALFSESQQIDPGEALLLATTINDPLGTFLTGDKRALRALSQHDCAPKFTGRILIVEQIVMKCLQNKGREWLLENICPYVQIDKAISCILGNGCDGSIESIEEGINSYINEIDRLLAPSLLSSNLEIFSSPN